MSGPGDEMAFPAHNNGVGYCGLTKREYFAAMAMQGILASWPANARLAAPATANVACEFADALIEALNAEPQS